MKGKDIRDSLFQGLDNKTARVIVSVEKKGVIAGISRSVEISKDLGITVEKFTKEGKAINAGEAVLKLRGPVKDLIKAEDKILGNLLKFSGIATASREAFNLSGGRIKIVSGAWKKMPLEIKQQLRSAIQVGGVSIRICDDPFIYLDKNYVRIFGSIFDALKAADCFPDYKKVIQLRGETGTLEKETREAIKGKATILMVDTGNVEDALRVITCLKAMGGRRGKKVAFSGGVQISEIPGFLDRGIDILDIGTQIIDAPLLDMKMDIIIGS